MRDVDCKKGSVGGFQHDGDRCRRCGTVSLRGWGSRQGEGAREAVSTQDLHWATLLRHWAAYASWTRRRCTLQRLAQATQGDVLCDLSTCQVMNHIPDT